MSGTRQTSFRIVELDGPDSRMDQQGKYDDPANPFPSQCKHCTMPDLDAVAKPYLLAKGFTAPAEMTGAEVGNFLVRPRVRKILELAVPGAGTFHPTAEMKSKKPTEWSLVAPVKAYEMPDFIPDGPPCSRCGEPREGYQYGDKYWEAVRKHAWPAFDLFKSKQWRCQAVAELRLAKTNAYRAQNGAPPMTWADEGITPPPHAERWTRQQLSRHLFFSLRLYLLLKKAKVKGSLTLYSAWDFMEPTDEDQQWVKEKLDLLADHGLVEGKESGKAAKSTGKAASKAKSTPKAKPNAWFNKFLKKHAAKKKPAKTNFAAIEKKSKLTLPQEYTDFLSTVGPMSFQDVMETEGFVANVLPPGKLDFRNYRRGKMHDLDEESTEIDGVMFATTDHGDVFVFDVATSGEWPVYRYDHEQNILEPFASSFSDCIRRFATQA